MIKKIKNLFLEKENNLKLSNDLACPICDSELLEHENHFVCSGILSGACNFKIPYIFKGKKISAEALNDIKHLVGYEDIFNKLDEAFYLNKVKKGLIEDKEFDYKETVYLDCPICRENIYRQNNTIFCSNKDCNFSLSTTFMGVTFSDEQIAELFYNRLSEEYLFFDKNTNKKIKGRVILHNYHDHPKGNPKYILVTDLKKLDKLYLNGYYLPKSKSKALTPIKTIIKQKNNS